MCIQANSVDFHLQVQTRSNICTRDFIKFFFVNLILLEILKVDLMRLSKEYDVILHVTVTKITKHDKSIIYII